jgi:hypothetical protein
MNKSIKFIATLIERSKYGPLSELFIMEAIRKEVQRVAIQDPSELPEYDIITQETWIEVAKDIQETILNYKP